MSWVTTGWSPRCPLVTAQSSVNLRFVGFDANALGERLALLSYTAEPNRPRHVGTGTALVLHQLGPPGMIRRAEGAPAKNLIPLAGSVGGWWQQPPTAVGWQVWALRCGRPVATSLPYREAVPRARPRSHYL